MGWVSNSRSLDDSCSAGGAVSSVFDEELRIARDQPLKDISISFKEGNFTAQPSYKHKDYLDFNLEARLSKTQQQNAARAILKEIYIYSREDSYPEGWLRIYRSVQDGKKNIIYRQSIEKGELSDDGDETYTLIPIFPDEIKKGPRMEVNGIKPLKRINEGQYRKAKLVAKEFRKLGYEVEINEKDCFRQVCAKQMSGLTLDDVVDHMLQKNNEVKLYVTYYDSDYGSKTLIQQLEINLSGLDIIITGFHKKEHPYHAHQANINMELQGLVTNIGLNLSKSREVEYMTYKKSEAAERLSRGMSAFGELIGKFFRKIASPVDNAVDSYTAKRDREADMMNEMVMDTLKQGGAIRAENKESCILMIDPACMIKYQEKEKSEPPTTQHLDERSDLHI